MIGDILFCSKMYFKFETLVMELIIVTLVSDSSEKTCGLQ